MSEQEAVCTSTMAVICQIPFVTTYYLDDELDKIELTVRAGLKCCKSNLRLSSVVRKSVAVS